MSNCTTLRTAFMCLLCCSLPVLAVGDEILWETYDTAGWQALEAGTPQSYQRARELFEEAIKAAPARDFRIGRSKAGLAWTEHRLRNNVRALECANEALELLPATPATSLQLMTRAEVLHVLGRLRCCGRDWESSAKHLKEAEEIYRGFAGQQDEHLSRLLTSFSELEICRLNPKKALRHLAEAVRKTRDPELKLQITLQQVDALTIVGEYRAAASLLSQPTASISQPSCDFNVFLTGRLAFLNARYRDALDNLNQQSSAHGGCSHCNCRCRNRIIALRAHAHVALQEFDAARSQLQLLQPDDDWERALIEAERLSVSAETAFELGEFAKSKQLFQQALDCREAILDTDDPKLCREILGLAASIECLGGQHMDTKSLCGRVRQIHEALQTRHHPDVARSLMLEARHKIWHRSYADAVDLAQDSADIFSRVFKDAHPDHASAFEVIAWGAWAYSRPGEFSLAQESAIRALDYRNTIQKRESVTFRNLPTLLNGWILVSHGELQLATTQFEIAAQSFESVEVDGTKRTHPFKGDALLGLVVSRLGRKQQERTFGEARRRLVGRLGRNATAYHFACLGEICSRHERLEEARWLYNEAATLYREDNRPASVKQMTDNIRTLETNKSPTPEPRLPVIEEPQLPLGQNPPTAPTTVPMENSDVPN